MKSNYNSKYLYSSGTSLYTSSATGTAGTATYDSRVWRLVSISRYGNSSSNEIRELSGFNVDAITLKKGQLKSPEITPLPANAIWADATDFTYSGYDISKLTYDSATGKFSVADSLTTAYAVTVTATHKVTGRTATFLIVANPRVALIAVNDPNPQGQHDTMLQGCEEGAENCGYIPYYQIGAYTTAQIDGILTDKTNKVVVIIGHGNFVTNNSGQIIGTCIQLNANDDSIQYRSNGSLASLDLSHLDLVVFLNCVSAYGGESADNLPSVAVERGAKTAIGFSEEVTANTAAYWLKVVFDNLALGKTVSEAINEADEIYSNVEFEYHNLGSHVICGDPSTKLTG